MQYIYGEFTDKQISEAVRVMHNDIHKLLLYKDRDVEDTFFKTEDDFKIYFKNLLFRFGGLNELLGEPDYMVALMSTLQAAYDEAFRKQFRYGVFRRAILDCHGYIKLIESEVGKNAESFNR